MLRLLADSFATGALNRDGCGLKLQSHHQHGQVEIFGFHPQGDEFDVVRLSDVHYGRLSRCSLRIALRQSEHVANQQDLWQSKLSKVFEIGTPPLEEFARVCIGFQSF